MAALKETRLAVRISAVLRGKLLQEAGDYGNLSNVVRVILERYFRQAQKGERR